MYSSTRSGKKEGQSFADLAQTVGNSYTRGKNIVSGASEERISGVCAAFYACLLRGFRASLEMSKAGHGKTVSVACVRANKKNVCKHLGRKSRKRAKSCREQLTAFGQHSGTSGVSPTVPRGSRPRRRPAGPARRPSRGAERFCTVSGGSVPRFRETAGGSFLAASKPN